MPPKAAPSKKNEMKKKEKVIEDKTFGLKNKKGAKTQKYIQQVQTNVKNSGTHKETDAQKAAALKKKEQEKRDAELAELGLLIKPVLAPQQQVGKDVDPKSVLCLFFKQGMCGKGNKCKFSHDLNIERKTEKRNMFEASQDTEKADDTMDKWDDDKLADVVNQKHGGKQRNTTDIICKYFLEALESSKYGWFWECPNGDSCIYKHALPQGYVLQKDKRKLDAAKAAEDQITIEELVEKERAALGGNLTKVTAESFLAWKKRKLREKQKAKKTADTKKKNEAQSGRTAGMSGRDLFTYNPDWAANDDDEAQDNDMVYEKEEEEKVEGEPETHEIDENLFCDYDGLDLDELDDEVDNELLTETVDRLHMNGTACGTSHS